MDRETMQPSVQSMPGKRARRWGAHHRSIAAPSTYVYDFVWDPNEDAAGPFCTDIDGNVLMDFTSHVAAAPLGYNNDKLGELPSKIPDPTKIAGQDFYASWDWPVDDTETPSPTQLLEKLVDLTSHYGMDTVFLSNSGAEAVENAIKICYNDGGNQAITFNGAFHGRTLGALSLNRSKTVHRNGFPEIPGVISAPYCTCQQECNCGWKTNGPGGNVIADQLHKERGHTDPDDVAYIILEPIQGEGGYRELSETFLKDLTELQQSHGISIIADEIQTGLGRTGKMWAVDHTPLDPDVITSAKALRVGATISTEDQFPRERGRLSSTWGAGDLLSSLLAVRTIEAIEEHGLLQNATARGRQMQELLKDRNHDAVCDVRGKGLMIGVEFDTKDRRDSVIDDCLKQGLLTMGCGHSTLRLLPPLDVTEREAELGVSLLSKAIRDTAQ